MSPSTGPRAAALAIQVVVIAKEPRPGAVKTRLCPPLTPVQAAALASAALADTCDVVGATPVRRRVVALEGRPGSWLPEDWEVVVQRSGTFGQRLAGAIEDSWDAAPLPILLIGMDTPQLDQRLLESAARALLRPGVDAVLGPAHDGGYWLLGTRAPVAGMFDGVPMSTDHTGAAQLRRLDQLGLHRTVVPPLRDVDTIADARAVAAAAPHTRFACVLSACAGAVPEEARV